jgi:FAD/FMN-containing dehydrogenase/Fe-S oxidoreductase
MDTVQEENATHIKANSSCEVRSDALTRLLYATDASIYQIEPKAVAFPRTVDETSTVIQAAAAEGIPVTGRGAGTGLAGGAVGEGLIIDFSKHNRGIHDLNVDARTVRVEAGVVLDQLNAYLHPHGLRFGPDVATSSRATLGGMINNNSSGSHVPKYGTTIESVRALDVILADGTVETIGHEHKTLSTLHTQVDTIIQRNLESINHYMPPGLLKRWAGYGLDKWVRDSADLTRMVGGSEGTLAIVTSAELNLVPLPEQKGLGVIFFPSVMEAMQATVELLDLKAAAIEHIDRVLFDQTRGQIQFKQARALLDLDDQPCEAILLVEFFEDITDKLNAMKQKNLGLRSSVFLKDEDQNHIWGLRKAGLSLLTGCKGAAKPTAGLEDVAVLPEKLPAYVEGLQSLMRPLGVEGSYYGHAASGLLHVRPVVDLHSAEDIAKYRSLADGVSALTKQFKGSIAAEHGVGIARTEFLPEHLGAELMGAMKEIKDLFDPNNVLNPGKIVPAAGYAYTIDSHLRQGVDHAITLPFVPVLAFAAKDESFIGNLEQCNGCGGCRKSTHTMCPTFIATGDEIMSTRGRANTIRAALEQTHHGKGTIFTPELEAALSNCLSCKACTSECPSNVNMALLKAELLHAKQKEQGVSLRDRMIARVDTVGKWASKMPRVANGLLGNPLVKKINESILGLSAQRPIPNYAATPFNVAHAQQTVQEPARGKVYLWDDCFVKYNEPTIGHAAMKVLNALGYSVEILKDKSCCGRPAFSTGQLDVAREYALNNVRRIDEADADVPVIFLEPSCYSMFKEDYRELGIEGMDAVEARCHLVEEFVADQVLSNPENSPWKTLAQPVAIHMHCHSKALTERNAAYDILSTIPDAQVTQLNTGCCGMAGAFGTLKDKYDLSVQVAQPLLDQIDALSENTCVVASGTSCRHQIDHLSECAAPSHIVEVLASALK